MCQSYFVLCELHDFANSGSRATVQGVALNGADSVVSKTHCPSLTANCIKSGHLASFKQITKLHCRQRFRHLNYLSYLSDVSNCNCIHVWTSHNFSVSKPTPTSWLLQFVSQQDATSGATTATIAQSERPSHRMIYG